MGNLTKTAPWLLVRRRHCEMIAASITPTGSWARNGASLVIGEGDLTDVTNAAAPST